MTTAAGALGACTPFSFGHLLEQLRDLFFGAEEADARAEALAAPPPVPAELSVLFARLWGLAPPVFAARNVREVRQKLGEVALSSGYAAFELEMVGSMPEGSVAELRELARQPLHLSAALVAQLGAEPADLVAQALRLILEMVPWLVPADGPPPWILDEPPSVEEYAAARYEMLLGDALPASVSEALLASVRGYLALHLLVGTAFRGSEPCPDWKRSALGEIAVEGMRAIQRFVVPGPQHLDLAAERARHAARKSEILLDAMFADPDEVDGDAESDEDGVSW